MSITKKLWSTPGIYLFAMIWWIIVLFVVDLFRYSPIDYHSSYRLYYLAFLVTFICVLILNLLEARFSFWYRLRHWGRIGVLLGMYIVTMYMIFFAVFALPYDFFDYFGGCSGGSFGMGFLPSAIFYILVGAIVAGILTVRNIFVRKHNR
jgi:hypothetical protein